jgi:hypothetical protein
MVELNDFLQDTMVHCIHFMTLLCGAMQVMTTSAGIGFEVEHLRSKPVWNQHPDGAERWVYCYIAMRAFIIESFLSLLSLLISHLEQPRLPDQEIEDKIHAFQRLFQVCMHHFDFVTTALRPPSAPY